MTGRVLSWDTVKRFGWVRVETSREDFFVHASALAPGVVDLRKGQAVE